MSLLKKKRSMLSFWIMIVCFVFLLGCDNQSAPTQKHCHAVKTFHPKYAKGFWIEYFNGFTVIHIRDAYDTTKTVEDYVLYPSGKGKPLDWKKAVGVLTPVQKNVCLSTTQIGFLDLLGLIDSVSGVVDEKRIYNPKLLSNIKAGTAKSVGNDGGMNSEGIFALQPSLVFAYSFNEGNSSIPRLQSLGLSVMMINDYNERDPLGRAEWIKVFGCIYGLEATADSIFSVVENEYNALKQSAKMQTQKPTVFCNLPWNDVWYMPSGSSYFANFISDAGGDFLWREHQSERVLNLDYEVVYAKAAKADYWLNPNAANDLNEMSAQSKRFENFAAFRNKGVYNNNLRQTPTGGNDFWESGVVQPHLVLKDLIGIFHPELVEGHRLIYYKQLD